MLENSLNPPFPLFVRYVVGALRPVTSDADAVQEKWTLLMFPVIKHSYERITFVWLKSLVS